MPFLRAVLNFMVAGALLGVLATTLVYPRYKAWDNTPGTGTALCNCADVTRQTADGLISAQMSGCAGGAGVGLLAGVAFGWSRRKAAKAKAASAAAAAPVAPPPAKA
jgi:hypothetical protein